MKSTLFNKMEYENIPGHFKNDNNNFMKVYKNGYSLGKIGEPESYFYKYPSRGTESSGRRKLLQAFRTPLAAIIVSPQLTLICSNLVGIIAGSITLSVGLPMIGVGLFLMTGLLCGAILLPKLWKKSKEEESFYRLPLKQIKLANEVIVLNRDRVLNKSDSERNDSSLSHSSISSGLNHLGENASHSTRVFYLDSEQSEPYSDDNVELRSCHIIRQDEKTKSEEFLYL